MRRAGVYRKLAGWKVAALALTLCAVASVFLSQANRPDFSDFKVYWVAGSKAAEHRTVYDVQGHYQYKYSPFVALLWSLPVAHLPGARYQWAWLHYAASGIGWYALWLMLVRSLDPKRAFWLWLALVAVFSVGVRDELKLGQANLWPFLLVLPAWFVPRRESERRGFDLAGFAIGVAWGLAIQWKLYALVLAPLWLLRRRAQVWVGAVCVTLVTLLLILSLVHGWEFAIAENVRWLQSLTSSSEQLLVSQYNVSALGILGKWSAHAGGSLAGWTYAVWAVLALGWVVALVWAERAAEKHGSRFLVFWSAAWAWAGIVVLNPLVWPYWLLFCAPLFLAYLSEATSSGLGAAGLRFWLVCGVFALMNWAQNYPVVHRGGSLLAVLLLLIDALVRARARDTARFATSSETRPALPFSQRG
jgi:hypothetical protein